VVGVGIAEARFLNGDRVMVIVGGGAYARYARVNSAMAMAVPDRLSFAEAAAIPEVFVTAHEALIHLGKLTSGGWARLSTLQQAVLVPRQSCLRTRSAQRPFSRLQVKSASNASANWAERSARTAANTTSSPVAFCD
jgi:hypothetical protein